LEIQIQVTPETLLEFTGFDQQVNYNLRIISISLSCQLPINLDKFEMNCHQTGSGVIGNHQFLSTTNSPVWWQCISTFITPTVHKIIVHSRQIIENTLLPVGWFG